MKRFILFIFLIILQQTYSQTDFRKGFLIDKKNDTIHGFINYTINSNKFEKLEFKSNLDLNSTIYLPNLINGYGFENNEYFKSKYIKDEKYEGNYFIENLVLGKIELYKLYNEFFVQKDTLFVRLDNEPKKVTIKNVEYLSEVKRFKTILNYLTSDCKNIKMKTEKIGYSESDLVELIYEYNSCKGGDNIVFKKNKPWFKSSLGVFLGYNFSTISNNRTNSSSTYFKESNTSKGFISYGAFLELGTPRVIERVSFYTGITYNSFDFYKYNISGNDLYELNSTIQQIIIPLAFRYTFPERKTTPYLTFGLLNLINIKNTSEWSFENNSNSQIFTTLEIYNSSVNSIGLITGIGFKRKINKKLDGFLDLNYQYLTLSNNTDSNLNSYQNNVSTIQILIGIRL